MPVFKAILRYHDTASGLGWTITVHRNEATPADLFLAADTWNDTYMGLCPDTVGIKDMRVSDVTLYRDLVVYPGTSFSNPVGVANSPTTEIGSYAQFRGTGTAVYQGSNAWKFHGISAFFTTGSSLNITHADVVAFRAACLVFLTQYRPNATIHLPATGGPVSFGEGQVTGMYFRRLGRPFGLPGQSR